MAMKNAVEVVIGGKVYKISGYESSEYLHQIAVYINDKMTEFQNMDSYRKQTMDQKQLMLNMNLADEFFKAKRQADKLSAELEKKERELYSVRHDLIEARLALENLQKEQKEKEQARRQEHQRQQKQARQNQNGGQNTNQNANAGNGAAGNTNAGNGNTNGANQAQK
ncbi:cell division protein ZapA [Anaerosacchariphilus sp. NSJ-68]|uniref:Cell division protein ZapA n=2 Tax=Lachnospiraceae TaxID=186803 RepID=A0A923LCW5_9FIRM|nr:MULTISPECIES: cell division protein ZapA [Lachnospiraceae]MBC5660031.1 cell division protein ZapA [Anaerosacchariphilus hominis]MBC5699146.1 cell division protein ZapA [Roseburia difficilis]